VIVVAPEPGPWIGKALESAGNQAALVVAPWARRPGGRWERRLPPRVQAAWASRVLVPPSAAVVVRSAPRTWAVVEVAARLWARGRADRRIRARIALRAAVDRIAARRLPPQTTEVHAASLAAQRTFAAARRRGSPVRCVLVEDLPGLRDLHDDLDRAAQRHPQARFLRRYRARPADLARQEAERVLAHELVVLGRWALARRRAAGVPAARLRLLVPPKVEAEHGDGPTHAQPPPGPTGPVVLLAGRATARGGLFEALTAAETAGATLLIHPGEGLEPRDALDRPRVRPSTPTERATLAGVAAVVAPAWCESYPAEVVRAATLGVPVVASARAAGHVDLAEAGIEVDPGDAGALARAIAALVPAAPG
jgi:glycosyltransferase involved in cell wall biosynthesis